jgi:hypothetical protein
VETIASKSALPIARNAARRGSNCLEFRAAAETGDRGRRDRVPAPQAQSRPQRLVKELHDDAAKIAADPLVEHCAQEIAHGLGPSGARAHTTWRAFPWLHQKLHDRVRTGSEHMIVLFFFPTTW